VIRIWVRKTKASFEIVVVERLKRVKIEMRLYGIYFHLTHGLLEEDL